MWTCRGERMRHSEFLPKEPASADYVLAVLRDAYRHAEHLDPESEPNVDLTFASTVRDWRQACDLLSWRPLGRALNGWFDMELPDSAWRAVLDPSDKHTLREVCALIAAHAQRPVSRPARIAGIECSAAGTFLVLRTLLRNAGVPVADLKPSTPLESVARRHLGELLTTAGRLVPGVIPTPQLQHARPFNAALILAGCGLIGLVTAGVFHASSLIQPSAGLLVGGVAGTWLFRRLPLRGVAFGSMRTFRDLVEESLARPQGAALLSSSPAERES